LRKYTYGFESETSKGELLPSVRLKYGFVKLYDGSITGNEYVSGIMDWRNLPLLEEFYNILKKTHLTNGDCSNHIHLGGIKYSEEKFLSTA